MLSEQGVTAILRVDCDDRQGLVSRMTDFIQRNQGNIVALDQFTDPLEKHFFMRLEWEVEGFAIAREEIAPAIDHAVARPCGMTWQLDFSDRRLRMCVMASKLTHCVYDLLARHQSGELDVDIPLMVGNHEEMAGVAQQFGIPFHLLQMTPDNKVEQEAAQLRLLGEAQVDFVVLARYMQILSEEFIAAYPERIINIHHSTLPAFVGARPYHQAYARGVKMIGATAHYVTAQLDQGPIIEQDVIRVSHLDTPSSMVRKGKDVEKIVLARAVEAHVARKTLVHDNKVIVFR